VNSPCVLPPSGAPVVALTLVGTGEPLIRLEKRLHCAAAGLGLRLELTLRKDMETFGIPYALTPAVLFNGKAVLTGLPRTEEIEAWLCATLAAEQHEDAPR
jgi:hypothetical protein